MNIIAIIPARCGSRGIPGKNIKPLQGRPLIGYVISLAKQAEKGGLIKEHIVSTDDQKIAGVAKRLGGNVPFLRPQKLAGDSAQTVDVVLHAVRWWEKHHKDKIHSVLLLQPTSPLTTIKDIDSALKIYLTHQPRASCLISVCEATHVRPQTLYYEKGKYLTQFIKDNDSLRLRQESRKTYWRNGSIYITRRDLLLQSKRLLNAQPLFYQMPRFRSIAIDDMFDWATARFLFSYQGKKKI